MVSCPAPILERLRLDYLGEVERGAVARAELARCERDAAAERLAAAELTASQVREALAQPLSPRPDRASRLTAALVVAVGVGLGSAGGACLASDCPDAMGWGALILGLWTGLGGVAVGW